MMPSLLVLLSSDIPRTEVIRLFGRSEIVWRGRVSAQDMRALASRALGCLPGGTLIERIAVETVVEMAGYDPEVALALAGNALELLLEAHEIVEDIDLEGLPLPTWSNGWMDEVDGRAVEHLYSLVARRDWKGLQRRVWQAHMRVMLPLVDEALEWFCRKYGKVIDATLPKEHATPAGTRLVEDARDVEPVLMRRILAGKCTDPEMAFLKALSVARNRVAHFQLVEPEILQALSSGWEAFRSEGERRDGWTWPRCGQTLTIMVGPNQGGKSHRVAQAHDREHVLDEEILLKELEAKYHGRIEVDFAVLLDEACRRTRDRLSAGASVVVDLGRLDAAARSTLAEAAPWDMTVVYEIVDRPVDAKRASALGTLLSVDDIVKDHAAFQADLPAILSGDGRANVKVVDLRPKSASKATSRSAA